VVVETKDAGDKFAMTATRPIPFEARSGDYLAVLLRRLAATFDRDGRGVNSTIALLKCSSGRFGSCLKAIKGEAISELVAFQKGLRVFKVPPQSLKRTLGWAADQKWRDRASELFNPDGNRRNWSKSAAGAAVVALKVAAELFSSPG
jgi:hypothetical protein